VLSVRSLPSLTFTLLALRCGYPTTGSASGSHSGEVGTPYPARDVHDRIQDLRGCPQNLHARGQARITIIDSAMVTSLNFRPHLSLASLFPVNLTHFVLCAVADFDRLDWASWEAA
jgi:hypothetical protein